MTASSPRELAEGRWHEVIDDPEVDAKARGEVRRLVCCSGKIAIDLLGHRAAARAHGAATLDVAICRVEQVYPLPVRELLEVIERYPRLEEVCWVQEEPENMGIWDFVRPSLEGLAGARRFAVLARPRSSSPAEGSSTRHQQNQERLLSQALDLQRRTSNFELRT